jgi:cytochrome c
MKCSLMLAAVVSAMTTTAMAATSGSDVFEQRCAVCHSLKPAPGKMGPPLASVVGRKAGTLGGYGYSNAMKASGITWNAETLDAYLKAPAKTVPGTKMLVGAPDAQQRAAVIQYLTSVKK